MAENAKDKLKSLSIDRSAPVAAEKDTAWQKPAALGAGVVVVVGGLLVWALSGGDDEAANAQASTGSAGSTSEQLTDATSVTAVPASRAGLVATGYVTARRSATVSADITGRIVEVLFEEGDQVEEGQILAKMDTTLVAYDLKLSQAQANAAEARARAVQAEIKAVANQLKRQKDLAARGHISTGSLESIEARQGSLAAQLAAAREDAQVARLTARRQAEFLDRHMIRAPFSGVVITKNVQAGEIVASNFAGGAGIASLVDMASLEVEADVAEGQLAEIYPGQEASIVLDAYLDRALPAKVLAIIPAVDRNRATIMVRVGFDQLDDTILPNMAAKETLSIFDGLDMHIDDGDFISIMGPSGSGKTTLLNMLGGLDQPSAGSIQFQGEAIESKSEGQLSDWRAAHVGFIFQFYNLMPTMTAARNVELPLLLTNLGKKERAERVATALDIVGLGERAKHKPKELSGGQQQRVAIARAIVSDPQLLLADEPTGDLDRETALEILDMLKLLNEELGKTIVMVTHDPIAAGGGSVTDFALMLSGLGRKKLRTGLLMFTIFIGFLIFAVLAAFRAGITNVSSEDGRNLIAMNKISLTQSMPMAHARKMAGIEGVTAVAHTQWIGAYYQEQRNQIIAFGVDQEGLFDVYDNWIMPEEQKRDFLKFRDSLLVHKSIADQYGWKIGDQIPLASTIWAREDGTYIWPVVVRGIYEVDGENNIGPAYIHFDYFDEPRAFNEGQIGTVLIRTDDQSVNDKVIAEIEELFANNRAQVKVMTENAFNAAFVTQTMNVGMIVLGVSGAAFITILMIVGNAMVGSIRERTGEIAVMKTIGFSSARISKIVIGEVLLLVLMGGLLGVAAAFFALQGMASAIGAFFGAMSLTPGIVFTAIGIMIALGILTSAIPAWRAMQININAVTGLTVTSMADRPWSAGFAVASIGLVILTLLAFLSMATGFSKTMKGTGAEDIAIIMSNSAETELNSGVPMQVVNLLVEAPGIKRDAAGKPIASPEAYIMVSATKKDDGSDANVAFRGVTSSILQLREGFQLTDGRMPTPGSNEIIVGAGAARQFEGLTVGDKVRFGRTEWHVVGSFAVPGTVFDSEIWADLTTTLSLFNREGAVSIIRTRLTSPEALQELKDAAEGDPRLPLKAVSEKVHYAGEAENLEQIVIFGWVLSITLALGALAGALNSMYAAVEARAKDLATLRAIGFGTFPAFVGAMVEALILSLGGGLLGAGIAWLAFNGISASSLGASFTQVVFEFSVGGPEVMAGMTVALILGLFGGVFPAIRAARTPILRIGQD
ncbi:yknY [Symbiodinium microadriaticum]|nr:yknY [Symbiodinium microadriaticum]